MQASQALGLPCSWAPLQSLTAAASRRIPCSRRASGEFAGQSHLAALSECRVSVLDSHPRRCGSRVFVAVWASPNEGEAGCSNGDIYAVSCVDRSRRSSLHAVTSDGAHANIVASSFTRAQAEARERVPPQRLEVGRSRNLDTEATHLEAHGRSCEHPPGFLRGPGVRSLTEVKSRAPSSRGGPPTGGPPKWSASARHAAGIRRRLPWGSVPFGV